MPLGVGAWWVPLTKARWARSTTKAQTEAVVSGSKARATTGRRAARTTKGRTTRKEQGNASRTERRLRRDPASRASVAHVSDETIERASAGVDKFGPLTEKDRQQQSVSVAANVSSGGAEAGATLLEKNCMDDEGWILGMTNSEANTAENMYVWPGRRVGRDHCGEWTGVYRMSRHLVRGFRRGHRGHGELARHPSPIKSQGSRQEPSEIAWSEGSSAL